MICISFNHWPPSPPRYLAHSCLSTATASRLQCCLRFVFVRSFWTEATLTQATEAFAPLLCTCAASDVYICFWKRVKERAGGTWCVGREYGLAIVIWSWWANANTKANACVEARIAAFKANSFGLQLQRLWGTIVKESLILLPLFPMTYFALNCALSAVRAFFFFFFSWTWLGPGHSHL